MLTWYRMALDRCHLTAATGGSVTSHKELGPNDENSLLLAQDGKQIKLPSCITVLVAGALWGLALERGKIA